MISSPGTPPARRCALRAAKQAIDEGLEVTSIPGSRSSGCTSPRCSPPRTSARECAASSRMGLGRPRSPADKRAGGRGAAWTEERGSLRPSDEGRRRLKAPGGERETLSEPEGAALPGLTRRRGAALPGPRSEVRAKERRGKAAPSERPGGARKQRTSDRVMREGGASRRPEASGRH